MGRNRNRITLALMLSVIPTVLLVPQPAQSADAGGITFVGTAKLDKFPCAIPTTCLADFTGTASGQVGGEQFGPWAATITSAAVEAIDVVYQDTNCVTGTAAGHARVTAGLQQVIGEYKPNNATGTAPLPILGLTIDADFVWNRAGGTAGIVFANGVVRATIAGMASPMVVASGARGGSTAAFHAHIDPQDPPDCNPTNIPPTNTPSLDAEVAGIMTFVDSNAA